MPFDRPSRPAEPDKPRESDGSDRSQDDRPRASEMLDDNGLNPAEYIAAWNKKVKADQASERRDVDTRDANGMTAAELRFQRNKRVEEAEAKASETGGDEVSPPRKSVVTDGQGRTGAEIRFQQAKRAQEAAKAEDVSEKPETIHESDKPEGRLFKTVSEELGESKTWRSFDAAKREIRARLGYEQGIQVDHIVEQCQGKAERSGFTSEQINSSDNMARLDKDLHLEKSKLYSRIPFGSDRTLRNMLNGQPWDAQLEIGCDAIDQELRRRRDQHDGE